MVIILGAHRNQSEADRGRQDDIYIYIEPCGRLYRISRD